MEHSSCNRPPGKPASQAGPSAARQLAALAIPTFGQLIAEPLFVVADTAIVGHVGNSALAGLSLGSTVILTAVGLCVFLAYATTSRVARLLGAGRRREGLQAGVDCLWLSLLIGVLLAAGLCIFAEPLCAALGGRGADLEQGALYGRLAGLGVPGMLLVYGANGIFRGLQKVRITLVAAVGGALLNTVLDILFVIVGGWGVVGSAAATLIAQWAMGLFLTVPALRWALRAGAALRPRLRGIARAGGDGAFLFLRTLALRGAIVITVMAAASMGTAVLGGYQIVSAAWNLMVNALDSVAIAGQALVGVKVGAGERQEARVLVHATARAGTMLGVAAGVLFALGSLTVSAFSPSAEVQAVAAAGMIVTAFALPLQGWMWALDGILIGAGDFRFLAGAVGVSAVVYGMALALVVGVICPLLPDDAARGAALWLTFDFILMGARALANGLRIRSDSWMDPQVPQPDTDGS